MLVLEVGDDDDDDAAPGVDDSEVRTLASTSESAGPAPDNDVEVGEVGESAPAPAEVEVSA